MKTNPHGCPPIVTGDCSNVIVDFLRTKRFLIDPKSDTPISDSEAAAAFGNFVGSMNIAAYVSTAIRDAGSEVAESLNRLARAIENDTAAADPEVLTRLRDVARRVGLSSNQVMKLSGKGEFPAYTRIEGVPFFKESQVTAWIAAKAESIQ